MAGAALSALRAITLKVIVPLMEKRRPHYSLSDAQAEVARVGIASFTRTARVGARAMGLTEAEALAVIACITPRCFYKSMTTFADHRVWQDVYHAPCPGGITAYVKLTMTAAEGVQVVIQFKEK